MHGRRSLIALAAVAAALVAAVVFEPARHPPARGVRDRVVPEAAEGGVTRVTITRSGSAPVTVARAAGGSYRITAPIDVPANAAAASNLFGSIETLSFRRRVGTGSARARGLDPARETIAIDLAGGRHVALHLGAYIDAAGQAWLARAGRRGAYLVGESAARSLDLGLDDLRARHPLPGGDVAAVEIDAGGKVFHAEGEPLAIRVAGGAVRMDGDRARALLGRIAGLEIERFTDRPARAGEQGSAGKTASASRDAGAGTGKGKGAEATPVTSVRVRLRSGARKSIAVRGACPGAPALRLITSGIGRGCVSGAALAALADYARAPAALFSRRLVRADRRIVDVAVTAGARRVALAAKGGGFAFRAPKSAIAKPVSRSATARWLTALSAAVSGSPQPAAQLASPRAIARIEIGYAGGDRDRLAVASSGGRLWARRNDEPVWWPLRAGAESLVAADPLAFRSRALWTEEPYALREVIRRRGGRIVARVARGQLASDWRAVVPAGRRANTQAIFRLRDLFGSPEAASLVAGASRLGLDPPREVIELHFDPPPIPAPSPGQAGPVHRVAIGRAAPGGGCYVRVDGDRSAAVLSPARCKALVAPLVSH